MRGEHLIVNSPTVVHETIDGETILIHMGTGTYYSLTGAGSELWGLVTNGDRAQGLVEYARAHYDAEPAEVEAQVQALVERLTDEGLVTAGDCAWDDADPSTTHPEPWGPFSAPVLEKYTDTQQFMLVDPIHGVDEEAGWPHAAAGCLGSGRLLRHPRA
ncbi:MAG: PqqD family protein [Solirubrobacteraceae bacterium]